MTFEKAPVCLITDEKQRFYYTDYASTDGYVVLSADKMVLVVDSRYLYEAKQVLANTDIEVVLGSNLDRLKEEVAALNAHSIGIDFSLTTIKEYERLQSIFPNVKFEDIGDEIAKDMIIKSDEQIERTRIACEIAQKSYYEILPLLKEGVTEKDIANELEFRFKKYGASDKSFDTIVAFGANAAVPHHESGNDRLVKDSAVLIDFGCIYKGYCSDMTRTCFFGTPNDEFVSAYNAVLEAHTKALEGIKAGITGREADAIARNSLKKCGRDGVFTHSLGHGIGLHIHELPNLSPRGEMVLQDGMIFSNEPGVYYDGSFGIRIEDSCYLKDGIAHSFMTDDKSLNIINA